MNAAYTEILNAVRKHGDSVVFDASEMEHKANLHLLGLYLRDEVGMDIDPKTMASKGWHRFNDFVDIGMYGAAHNRTIPWSDDGRQPDNERLLRFSFSCGAYMFGHTGGGGDNDDYPTEFFQRFWNELLAFKPAYTDTPNHGLYFSMENAGPVFNSFDGILKKYIELNRLDAVERKKQRLREQLEKLELDNDNKTS